MHLKVFLLKNHRNTINSKNLGISIPINNDLQSYSSLGDEKSSPKDLFDNIIKKMYETKSKTNKIQNIKELFKNLIFINKNWFEWIQKPIKNQIIHFKNKKHFKFTYTNTKDNKKLHITIFLKPIYIYIESSIQFIIID